MLVALLLLTVAAATGRAESLVSESSSTLASYLAKPDSSYRWEVKREGRLRGTEFVELLLVSQTWRDIPWKHQLYIIKPKRLKDANGHGLLMISGGRWRAEYEQSRADADLPRRAKLFARLAKLLRSPVAVLRQVPHQPIYDGLTEDRIIAHTFDQYLRTGDAEWPLLLPMVKSASKAMDATQEFAASRWAVPLKTFTVIGGSKRGWTTWLVGAADERATAIAPAVIDMLRMEVQFEHQKAVWGGPSYKIKPYTDIDLDQRLPTENGRALQEIVDPYSYRQVLRQPKLIVIGTNDHYWPLDALNLYWSDLIGPKYALYLPNDRHSISDYRRVFGTVRALHQQAATGAALPNLQWQFDDDGNRLSLQIATDIKPRKVSAWVAHSASRDFRQANWTSQRLARHSDVYRFEMGKPAQGYGALFGEAVFGRGRKTYYLSTNVRVIGPDVAVRHAD